MSRFRILFHAILLMAAISSGASTRASAQIYMPGAEPYVPPKDTVLTIRVHPLADGVYAAKVGTTWSGWVEMQDGIMVIDATMADSAAAALSDTIQARSPGRPYRYLVLTHADEDHILGAKRFLDAGATLVLPARSAAAIDSVLGIRPNPKTEIRIEKNRRFGSADRPVDVLWLGTAAYTQSDLVVHLPKQRVLFAGDLVWNRSVPWLLDRHLNLSGWQSSLDSLSTKRFAADSLVPGHGDIAPPAQAIQFTRNYLRDADEKASETAGWGTSLADVRKWGYLGPYEGMEFYDEVHFLNMRRLYNEAKGIKTPGRGRIRAIRK